MDHCINCGADIKNSAKFCPKCGKQVISKDEKKLSSEKEKPRIPQNKISGAVSTLFSQNTAAPPVSGEAALGGNISAVPTRIPDLKSVITNGFFRLIKGILDVFKDKRKLIPAMILVVLWVLLPILTAIGADPFPVKLLSALTFASGGLTGGFIGVVGGIIGKGVVAGLFISLISGGHRGIKEGISHVLSDFRKIKTAGIIPLLIGAGAAMILYNFFAGIAAISQFMAGIAGIVICLRALGNKTGFIIRLITSLTAKKSDAGKSGNPAAVNGIITGLSAGFALSVLLSFIPFGYTPYCAGAAALIAAAVLYAVKNKDEVAAV